MKKITGILAFFTVMLFPALAPGQTTDYYNNLTRTELENKNYEKAIEYAGKSLAVTLNGAAYWNRGNAYAYLKKYDESASDYMSAIVYYTDRKKWASLWYNIGDCRFQTKSYESALHAFQTSESYGYDDKANLYAYLGDVQRKLGKYQEAILSYQKVEGLTGDRKLLSEMFFYTGDCYLFINEYEKAFASLQKAEDNGYAYKGELYGFMGDAKRFSGKYEDAISFYQKAEQWADDKKFLSTLYYFKGDSYDQLNDHTLALQS